MKKMTLLLTTFVIAGGSLGPVLAENLTPPTLLCTNCPG